jgi:hypothetical protein
MNIIVNKDKEYFDKSVERYERHIAQQQLFKIKKNKRRQYNGRTNSGNFIC